MLAASFVEASPGDLSKLALAINLFKSLFLNTEVAAGKRASKEAKSEREDEKARKLKAAIRAEKEAKVQPGTLGQVFAAHEAAAEVDGDTNSKKKRDHYESKGLEFKITIPTVRASHTRTRRPLCCTLLLLLLLY